MFINVLQYIYMFSDPIRGVSAESSPRQESQGGSDGQTSWDPTKCGGYCKFVMNKILRLFGLTWELFWNTLEGFTHFFQM